MTVVFDVDDQVNEPDHLQGLVKGPGCVQRNPGADLCNFFQFSLAHGVGLFGSQLFCQTAVPGGKGSSGLHINDHGIPEVDLFLLFLAVHLGFRNFFQALLLIVVQAVFQQVPVIRQDMAGAAIPVAYGHNAAFFCVLGVLGQSVFYNGVKALALPAGQDAKQFFPVFRSEVQRVALAGRELVDFFHDPLRVELREYWRTAGTVRLVADDQFPVLDENCLVSQNMGEHISLLEHGGFKSIGFNGLRSQTRTLRADAGFQVVLHLFQLCYSLAHISLHVRTS